jgi:hypothetical protein
MYQKTWSGDWHARVLDRVQQLGFCTVTQYVAERPGVSLLALAQELGTEDIAAVQVMCMLLEEAIRTNTLPRLLRDLFERELRKALPEGWTQPLDDATRYQVAGAISGWYAELQDHLDHAATMAAGKALLSTELPAGWLPDGPDDPVIITFVDRCLGRAPS